MTKTTTNSTDTHWRFRREVTLGTVLHLTVLLLMAITAWSNLQKELAIIQHDLTRLVTSNANLQQHIEQQSATIQLHECRLQALEQKKLITKPSPIISNNNDWDAG